ncbi:DUF3592 domain-containing protein [Myxococcus stipitatus]|uniref:DUF3592 domain-containing protein n=1 Tax=Myxococcus stipitatus TaxID=83455 RepID=UPI001F2893DD|nr:DUF3592 domain-containing protein [Myxococcus stipitatus]MCE9673002.1 DUF3592 domain-containing protein [Myxococcus stipitatus]
MRVLWVVVSIICALLAAVGVVFLVAGVKDLLRALRSRRWPTVPGTVLSAEEVEHRLPVPGQQEPRVHYEARVRYEYTVGRVLVGTASLRLSPEVRTNPASAQATLRRYQPGQQVWVAYNPADPTDAVLEPGPQALSFVRGVIGLGLLGVAAVIPPIARWFLARL